MTRPRQRRGPAEHPLLMCVASLVAPWAALAARSEGAKAAAAALVDVVVAAAVCAVALVPTKVAGAPLWALGAGAASVVVAVVVRVVCAWGSVGEARWRRGRRGETVSVWPSVVVGVTGSVLVCALGAAAVVPVWGLVELDAVFGRRAPVVAVPEDVSSGPVGPDSAGSGRGGRVNVLLVGTDAGQGRVGARTDSMNLVSVDPSTGDAWTVALPRNLQHVPMPDSAKRSWPDGFDGLLNAVWGWAEAHRDQAPDPEDPGASTLKAVVANVTGQPVHYVVVARMQGLDQVVDAVGGVDVENLRAVPLTPLVDDPRPVPKVLAAGVHHMDGPLAVAFARSRKADSDYQRMARQRCVLEAVAKKLSSPSGMRSWPLLVRDMSSWVRTDAPRSEVDRLAGALSRVQPGQVRGLALVPPLVDVQRPDVAGIRAMVSQLAAAGAPAAQGQVEHGALVREGENSASLGPTSTTTTTTTLSTAATGNPATGSTGGAGGAADDGATSDSATGDGATTTSVPVVTPSYGAASKVCRTP